MENVWHYAEGSKSVGPISVADLTTILSRVSNAKDVLVWRDGFSNWEKAENVPELAAFAIKPPPLPNSPPPVPQETGAAALSPFPIVDPRPDLVGLAGWLILPVIGTIISAFLTIKGMADSIQ